MALQDAVLEIVGQMEQIAGDVKDMSSFTIRSFALALKMAVKAAEGTAINPISSLVLGSSPESAALQNRSMIDAAREDLRRGQRTTLREEQSETRMAVAVGGPDDGTYVPIDPRMPAGAMCELSGSVYRLLEDGQLHFEEQ